MAYQKLHKELDEVHKKYNRSSKSIEEENTQNWFNNIYTSVCRWGNAIHNQCTTSIVCITIIVLLAILVALHRQRSIYFNDVKTFTDRLYLMKKDFPNNQDNLVWNMLKNGGHRHLKKVMSGNKKQNISPLSYLLAGYSGSISTVDCFSKSLAHAYTNNILDSQIIDLRNDSLRNNRKNLVDEISDKLSTGEVLMLKNIEYLEFQVAQIFMSYADEHSMFASHPSSVLLFTTELPFPYDATASRHSVEGAVKTHFLRNVWQGALPDFSTALWTRLGDGLVLIRGEEQIPC